MSTILPLLIIILQKFEIPSLDRKYFLNKKGRQLLPSTLSNYSILSSLMPVI